MAFTENLNYQIPDQVNQRGLPQFQEPVPQQQAMTYQYQLQPQSVQYVQQPQTVYSFDVDKKKDPTDFEIGAFLYASIIACIGLAVVIL